MAQTLDELRLALAPAIAEAAVFDGWSETAVVSAAQALDVDANLAVHAFSVDGTESAMAMISAWTRAIDEAMADEWPAERLAGLPVHARIRTLLEYRLDAAAARVEALRRALAIMTMPRHAAETARLGWSSADLMWRLAGDTATDFNHYSKRALLAGIYAATLLVLVDDQSEGRSETRAFLARRLSGIARFGKAREKLAPPDRAGFSVARFLGRLRYPAR